MHKEKILVIGVNKIRGANTSLTWLQPLPTLGNFHETYLYLPSLSESVMERLVKQNHDYFQELKDEIFECLKAGLSIYCVTAPLVRTSGLTNYDFLPFSLKRFDKKINTFKNPSEKGYLSTVKEVDGFFESNIGYEYLLTKIRPVKGYRVTWKISSYLESLHNKLIAFSIRLVEEKSDYFHNQERWTATNGYGGGIIFLPPVQEDPIAHLETIISDDEPSCLPDKPEWFSAIELPGVSKMKQELDRLKAELVGITDQIQSKEEELNKLEGMKWVTSLKGKALEIAVDSVFAFLGIPLLEGAANQEDRWLEIDGAKIPIEIKGHEQAVRRKDLRQILDRTKLTENSLGKTLGILIANPYCYQDPQRRPSSFDDKNDKLVSGAEGWDIALVDTLALLDLVIRKLKGEKNLTQTILKTLTTSIGIVKFTTISG